MPLSRPLGRGFGRLAVARVRWWVGMVVRVGCPCVPCLSRVPCVSRLPRVFLPVGIEFLHVQTTQDSGARARGLFSAFIEARFPVAAHARGHNLEFGAPVQRRLVQGVGTTSSGRALRRTDVPRRSYSESSSYSSFSSSMLMAWWSPIDQRETIQMRLHPTYQSPS